ncbi:MAG TPA: RNA polymerase sigma factor, partial [Devosia sp.]|nr:RNA polymerase sigma factor [Devosia sp.]
MSAPMTDRQMKEALVREAPALRRFARSLVGDPALADDLVQDTFERALTRLHLYDARRALRPWLFRILRNLRISRFRQVARRGSHVELVEGETAAPSGSGSPDQGLALRDISRALDMLPDE